MKNKRYINVLLAVLLVLFWIGLLVCAYQLQQYRFFAKEAEHLWISDEIWIFEQLQHPSGVVQLLTSALTQFYSIPFVGPVVTTLIGFLIYLIGVGCLRTIGKGRQSTVFSNTVFFILPAVFLFLCHENVWYSYRGDVALMVAMLFGYAFVQIVIRLKQRWMISIVALFLTGVAYLTTGSAAVITVVVVCIYSFNYKQWLAMPMALVAWLLLGWYSVKEGHFISMEEAFTPLQYYEWPSTYYFQIFAWASVLVALVVGTTLQRINMKPLWQGMVFVGVIAFAIVQGITMYRGTHNSRNYELRTEEWLCHQEDWDGIIAMHEGSAQQTCFISYLNLALAQKGLLTERLFQFNPLVKSIKELPIDMDSQSFQGDEDAQSGASRLQQSVDSAARQMICAPLLMKFDEFSREASKLQSAVQMAWGGAALCNAHKAAFEANMLTPGQTDAQELKIQIITNAVFGTPKVAEKYLHILQKTTFYKDWANEKLSSKDALEKLAAPLRKGLPENNALYMKTQVGKTLQNTVLDADGQLRVPVGSIASQFYEAYILLTLDKNAILHWAQTLKGEKLSSLLQQAICVFAQPDEISSFGVSYSILQQFQALQQHQEPTGYGTSFWNFYYSTVASSS